MGILNAYYLPELTDSGLHESITPVNSFRVLFNHYFDADLELLPNANYVCMSGPYDFVNVTERLRVQ